MKKIVLLSTLVLLLSACSKESDVVIESKLQAEALLTPENGTFVSLAKATDIASVFFGTLSDNPATKSNARIASTETIRDSKRNNDPSMYVVNYSGGGFVIVGASKDYYPILAYSDENNFAYKEEIGGLVIWMEETQEAIRQSENMDEDTKSEIRNLWAKYGIVGSVSPTPMKTKAMDPLQEAAYQNRISELQNGDGSEYTYFRLSDVFYEGAFSDTYGAYTRLCGFANSFGSPLEYTIVGIKDVYSYQEVGPLMATEWHQDYPFNAQCNGNKSGCVAIAMAQIMKFHQHPSSYNWSNMPYTAIQTNPAVHSTPQLIADIGTATGMIYGLSASGTTDAKAKSAFQNTFSYNAMLISHNINSVMTEILTNKRPVYMAGSFTIGGAGHAWVCDGAHDYYTYHQYFIEFLAGNQGNYYYTNLDDTPTLEFPYRINNFSAAYFHMNWGEAGIINSIGWYVTNNVATSFGNPQYDRLNIYVYPN